MELVARVRQATALLESASQALTLEDVPAGDAIMLARAFAQAEKVAMAATRRAVLRAGDAGARHHGGERDMVGLTARLTGTTVPKARQGLKSAERASALPGVAQAYVGGSLSFEQAAVVTDAVAVDPATAKELLHEVEQSSLASLKAAAAAAVAARSRRREEDMLERERRLAAGRFCRVGSVPGGGVRLEALLPTQEGATLMRALGSAADRRWRQAWAEGCHLSMDQARADALVAACTAAGAGAPGAGAPGTGVPATGAPGTGRGDGAGGTRELGPPELVVTVDAAALVRGEVHGGEVCQIDGVGPVPVAIARGLLGEALLTICVTDGVDVRTVTSTTRVVPTRVRKALALRDPVCVVPGCGQRTHLEIDHWRVDFSRGGLTELDNLCRLCPSHHRLKTRTGWRIEGGPARWRWLAPRHPARSRSGHDGSPARPVARAPARAPA